MPKIFSILFILLMPGLVMAGDDLKAWPTAEAGYNRYVIRLAPMGTEANHQVEIMAGGLDRAGSCEQGFGQGACVLQVLLLLAGRPIAEIAGNIRMLAAFAVLAVGAGSVMFRFVVEE